MIWESIIPLKYAQPQDIHEDWDRIDDPNGDKFGFHGFSGDHKDGSTEKMKIANEKNQPDACKGPSPKGIFPDQVAAQV